MLSAPPPVSGAEIDRTKEGNPIIPAHTAPGQTGSGAEHRPASSLIKLCFLFAVCIVGAHLLLWLVTPDPDPLAVITTATIGWLLEATGINIAIHGTYITLGNNYWEVSSECTAVNVVILFASFVLAYGASLKAKILALITGIPFIVLANLARLFVLAWITELFPGQSRFFHDYAWQAAFVILVVAMWLAWIELVVKREKNSPVSG